MFKRIPREELPELARQAHLTFGEGELEQYHALTEYIADIVDGLVSLPEAAIENVAASRDPGRRPGAGEDPYNAVVRWCNAKLDGAEGLLSGVKLGVKDSIPVAGIPLTGGSSVLRDFVPAEDAEVTRRVLLEGAEIVAMLNMDYMAFSGGGDTSAHGPTLCPFDTSRTAGGSSGGSGAALYYDDVDITLGCDQGGSIRIPASWCGVLGLKPSYGLVPYTGILALDHPIDHVGPMARNAADLARLLQAIAGRDPLDPRQPDVVPTQDYVRAVQDAGDDLKGLKIGVVTEGFSDAVGTEPEVRDAVRAVVDQLAGLGAEVREVSAPEHLHAGGLAVAGFIEGMTALLSGGGNGHHWRGHYSIDSALALGQGLKDSADGLSPQVKLTLMFGSYMMREYYGTLYAKAHNLHPWLRAGYDRPLGEVDVLVMPTTPLRPHAVDPSLSISERVMRGWSMLGNTAATNLTGHPALSVPAAEVGGLPVGVMLIGRQFDDARLLSIASTYERSFGWSPQHPGDPRRG